MCQIMMRTVQPSSESKQATSLQVAVRCRPLTAKEKLKSRDILRVVDDKVVVVLDPDVSKEYLDRVQNRSKEKKYAFDIAFGAESTNLDVYNVTVSSIVEGVLRGLNATIFAYGATGRNKGVTLKMYYTYWLFAEYMEALGPYKESYHFFICNFGKTHTMAGTPEDPGLMVLSLQSIFSLITKQEADYEFVVTCSYLEVYNEVIYDLLERSSGHLELREDPDQGITVAGLKRIQVNSAEKILELLTQGNARRKTESTDANATSSRSHAVLEIIVKRKQRNQYRPQMLRAKLALVDLAGSERASETNNVGQKLRDGANINRSLLALANCINALGKQQKKGLAYVPYRNSKLTRLLKDGLSGNSRTVMVTTISSGADQYHHTTNTLKYADRAKEIKTHVQAVPDDYLPRISQPVRTSGPSIIARRVRERGGDNYDTPRGASYIEVKGANTNGGTVDAHVADYQRLIDNLQVEVTNLRRELADKETLLSARTPEKEKSADDELSWLDMLSHDINDNVEERINLQKALFELEDMNLHNRAELQRLDELIADPSLRRNGEKDDALVERRQVVLDNIRDNDEAGAHYRQDIETNEAQRKELQRHIDEAIDSDRNKTFLRILTQYRLLGMTNMELQFQMAIRDQIIHDQREALSNLWLVLECSGLKHEQIAEIAAQQGIMIDEGIMPAVAGRTHVPSTPIPILHKQPPQAAISGNKQLAPGQQQSDDAVVTSEYDDCGSQPWREHDDSAPGSPHDGKDSPLPQGYGDHPRAESSTTSQSGNYETPADLREDGEGSVQVNQDNVGNKKPRGPRSVWSVESASSDSVNTISLEQSSWKNSGDGPSTSSPTLMVPRTSTYARSRRRPRSAERWQQSRRMHESYETTTGNDAASEGSEAGGDNDSSHDKQSGAHFDRAQSADNQLLRKVLSRLDKELQDLKRGIEKHTTSSESHAPIKDATDTKEVSRQGVRTASTSPLFSTNRFQSNGSPAPLPTQLKSRPAQDSASQDDQPFAGTFAVNGPSCESYSKEVGLPPQETGVSKVSLLTGSNFSNGHTDVNSRRSTLKDRRKPKFDLPTGSLRQSWPRNGTDWK